MKTLSEHNAQHDERQRMLLELMSRTGLACDKCGAEMLHEHPHSRAPKRQVKCPKCHYRGLMIDPPAI